MDHTGSVLSIVFLQICGYRRDVDEVASSWLAS